MMSMFKRSNSRHHYQNLCTTGSRKVNVDTLTNKPGMYVPQEVTEYFCVGANGLPQDNVQCSTNPHDGRCRNVFRQMTVFQYNQNLQIVDYETVAVSVGCSCYKFTYFK